LAKDEGLFKKNGKGRGTNPLRRETGREEGPREGGRKELLYFVPKKGKEIRKKRSEGKPAGDQLGESLEGDFFQREKGFRLFRGKKGRRPWKLVGDHEENPRA